MFARQVCKGSQGQVLGDWECWGNIHSLIIKTDIDTGVCSEMWDGNRGRKNFLRHCLMLWFSVAVE